MRKNLQNLCKGAAVITADARKMLCTVAGPRDWSDTRQSWLARAARRLGWDYSRTSNVFYGRARIIRAEEWIRLNEELGQLTKSAVERQGVLNELEILARSGPPPARKATRSAHLDRHPAGQARPWGQRGS